MLKWIPGDPSGPTKQVYYSTAYHAGGNFTLAVVSVCSEKRYILSRAGKAVGPPWFKDKLSAAEYADAVVEVEEVMA